jgi:SPOR domain
VSKNFDALTRVDLASRSRPRLAALAAFIIRAKDCVDPLQLEARANAGLRHHGTSRYLIWFFLGVLLLSANIIFLRHYARGMGDNRQAIGITSAGKVPGILSPGSTVEQSTSTPPATISRDVPGFVLQVAAMKHEDNADALAETLHQRNFPAFVFKRGAGPFYRVTIGVYGDADSAVRIKDELERQGFKAILRRWLPE